MPSVLVDVSGNQDVVRAVHARLGDGLACSLIVGDTHWDHQAGRRPAGCPARARRSSSHPARSPSGPASGALRSWTVAWPTRGTTTPTGSTGWLILEHAAGPDAVIEVFRTYLAGRVDPRVGTICTLATQEVPA